MSCPQLVNEWAGTSAQVRVSGLALIDIAAREGLPTLADVNAAHGNKASLDIIAKHLVSVVNFAGVAGFTRDQAAETATAILSGYYFLNLAELAMFFHRLKCGEYGQQIYGRTINNQGIMVALHDFADERRRAVDKNEAKKKQNESMERRQADYVGAVQDGIAGSFKKACEDFGYFLLSYPPLRGSPHAVAWWEYFKKDPTKGNKAILDALKSQND